MRKFFQKKSAPVSVHLTAEQARAISIDEDLIDKELRAIYLLIRSTAKKGGRSICWSYLTYSEEMIITLYSRLKRDGYNIKNNEDFWSWTIGW